MANTQGGFDAVFIELSERFMCPICQLALEEPLLTICGHNFCKSCLSECLGQVPSCPVCREELKASSEYLFPNKALKREILDLKIKCNQLKKGCEWVGELREKEDHDKQCEYVGEVCANKCGEQVMRKAVRNHLEKLCPRRKTSCEYCCSTMEWKELQDHYKKCPKYPVKCTYNCGETVARYEMTAHVGNQGTCPNSLIDCKFKNIGCSFKGKRRELSVHIKDDAESHFSLMANRLVATEQELEETKSKLAMVVSHRNFSLLVKSPESFVHTWRIENWSQKILEAKARVKEFTMSNLFYVPPGYHLHLRALATVLIDDNCYLGVYLFATEGDFDGVIKWPFPFSFTLEVVDQQPAGKNISFKFSPPYRRALQDPATSVVGAGKQMASHETLETQCYIKDDAVIIKLTVHVKNY